MGKGKIAVGLHIDELRRKYELHNIFQSTQELIIHLENIKKSKQGFFKKKDDPEIQELELALDMLKGSKRADFIITIHYYDGDIKELSLFSADELLLYDIADFVDRNMMTESCLKWLYYLANTKKMQLARYLYAYLSLNGYFSSENKYGITNADALIMIKAIAEAEYYKDAEYMRLAKELYGAFCFHEDLFEYAEHLSLYLSVYYYKKDLKISYKYLVQQYKCYREYMEDFDSRFYPAYIQFELARRSTYGIGCTKDYEAAISFSKSIQNDLTALLDSENSENKQFFVYDFENDKYTNLPVNEMRSRNLGLIAYITSKQQAVNAQNTAKQEIKDIQEENAVQKQIDPGEASKNKRNWDKVEEYTAELNSMQGLVSVKRKVSEIINSIKVAEYKREKFGDESASLGTMHLIFTGNAGTGKTTVARILGKIYAELGVLEKGDIFVECGRADLVGKYQGHTASNVKEKVQEALDGILFIDEAYSLVHGSGDDFGREAVDTLVAEIENHRDNLMVIIAGYKDKMDEFLKSNQGLSSRFATGIMFEDYSVAEMVAIINNMAANQKMAMRFDESMQKYLVKLLNIESRQDDFGNARGVRNVFEKLVRKKENNIADAISKGAEPTKEECYTIRLEDIMECPDCGNRMALRNGKYGRFFSCLNYSCKKTMSVEEYFK